MKSFIRERGFAVMMILAGLWVSACSSFEEGVAQDVTILSYPSGAEVTIGGQAVGKTPLTVPLGSKIGHEVRVSLYGHDTYVTDVLPQFNEEGRGQVRFGLAEETGAYNKLKPNPVIAVLRSTRTGAPDDYEVMMALIEVNDQRLKAGKIDEETHRSINKAITEHFLP